VEGDPRRASAEIGRALVARIVDRSVAAIRASIAAR
jgi:creatinine amidohydrolase/Fe(II)-dependent formamide hydrolase-like protein